MVRSVAARARTWGLALVLGAGAYLAQPSDAHAVVLERVVAVIGDKPILLSELRNRAKPELIQIQRQVPEGAQRTVAESRAMKSTLERMIEDELQAQAATRARVTVTPDEVNNTLRGVAAGQGRALSDIFRDARRIFGLSEQEYRDEIRRQVLEGKMLQLRVRNRIRLTEEDLKAGYQRLVREERRELEYKAAWLVVRVQADATPAVVAERKAYAETLAKRAETEDFTALVAKHSDDAATRDKGGDLGIRANAGSAAAQQGRPTLGADLEAAVQALEPGGVTKAIRAGDAFVVLKLAARAPSRLTSYEASKQEVERVLQEELFRKAKKKWMEELRTRTHVEVRL
jgi:peptidyl-prolyl cis-trans isomerase SurA